MLLQSFQDVLDLRFKVIPFDKLHRTHFQASVEAVFLLCSNGYILDEEHTLKTGKFIQVWKDTYTFTDHPHTYSTRAIIINSKIITPCKDRYDEGNIKLKFTEDI